MGKKLKTINEKDFLSGTTQLLIVHFKQNLYIHTGIISNFWNIKEG